MCGIVVVASAQGRVDRGRVATALGLLAHRGPDGEGIVERRDGAMMMGHRRLAIYDTTALGAQPMIDPETGNTIVFNGSIYNFPELRAHLIERGHGFRTRTDTEVILAAWREWGSSAFEKFNGTWALALHDHGSDRLVLSRDRAGVRPLYMLHDSKLLVIASEVRSVLAAAGRGATLDQEAVLDFVALGLSDHSGRTMVRDVVDVPPGALWTFERNGALSRGRFHRWPAPDKGLSAREVAGRLPELLVDATRLRMQADVPVAAQLSGGLDSGAVAWAIQQCRPAGSFLGYFTYGYSDAAGTAFDESADAADTLSRIAPGQKIRSVRHTVEPAMQDLGAFLEAQELPVNTPSPLAGLRLARAMREAGAVVALGGDGSDEIFSGYESRYYPIAARDRIRQGRWREAASLVWRSEVGWRRAAARLAWDVPFAALRPLLARRPSLGALSPAFLADMMERLRDLQELQRETLQETIERDLSQTMLPQVLRFADRNAMRSGMESRSPFLDYRIMELAARLPATERLGAARGKVALREAMRPHLPDRVITGAKRRGLGHAEQFQIGMLDLKPYLERMPSALEGIIDPKRLSSLLATHSGEPTLWWPVCLVLWQYQVETRWR